jgi:hypothetical protein
MGEWEGRVASSLAFGLVFSASFLLGMTRTQYIGIRGLGLSGREIVLNHQQERDS